MRKELYERISQALLSMGGTPVAHVDLWNHNVEFVEQETAWPTPAVFVEFEPIRWTSDVTGIRYHGEVRVRLHVVTEWRHDSMSGCASALDLTDAIRRSLAGMEGETFKDLDLVESHTNHNHEDLVESIEVYSCVAVMYN